MIKKIMIPTLLALGVQTQLFALNEQRAHVGIAHDTNSIHLGYDIDQDIRVETYFAYDETNDERVDLGVGAFYKKDLSKETNIYMGARFGVVDFKFADGGVFAMPAFGGEYMVHQDISVGAEVGVATGSGDIPTQTQTNLTLRYYF